MAWWEVFHQALMITGFVGVMMILVEYVNVLTQGRWQKALQGSRWTQVLMAVVLGGLPGCLGAFVIVALYIHRTVSLGALVACMIATSGDESFVMLAMFPGTAALLFLGLMGVGLIAGVATDWVVTPHSEQNDACLGLVLHDATEPCHCFDASSILPQLRTPSAARGMLVGATALFALAILAGTIGPAAWNWIRITLLVLTLAAFFISATVPEHFLEEHLWRHVVIQHVPRIFLWTFGAMCLIAFLGIHPHTEFFIRQNKLMTLVMAGLVGLVPESGPHLFFVTLFDHGSVPASVLAVSSIVQDGHGMLPLLAHSWRDFVKVKAINLAAGLMVGFLMYVLQM